ncbi:MAG: hypothetical protein WCQ99_00895 [Pseudomonadota bacterium]
MITLCSLPNWEIAAFYLISCLTNESKRNFTRHQIMNNIDEIIPMLIGFGHKKKPAHPEETLQKTLQNMRDKRWIEFLERGDYKLTQSGFDKLQELKKDLQLIEVLKEAFHQKRKEIISGDFCLEKGKAGSTTI